MKKRLGKLRGTSQLDILDSGGQSNGGDDSGTELAGGVADHGELAPCEEGGWDEGRGRGPGHPDEEAVERARGDRNRTLFVE